MVIYCLFWILGFVNSHKCYNSSSDGVTESWFCCNNFEYRNGTCKECKIGYVSKDGSSCLPCLYGRYGKKCVNTCSCQHNERCDVVFGCIEGTTVIAATLEEKVESTFAEPKEAIHVMTTSGSVSAVDKNDGLLRQWKLMVSLISVGSIATIVTLTLCCFKNKMKAEHLNRARSKTVNRYYLSIKQEHDSKDNTSEYDLIDYSVINNDSLIRIVTNKPMENYNLN